MDYIHAIEIIKCKTPMFEEVDYMQCI